MLGNESKAPRWYLTPCLGAIALCGLIAGSAEATRRRQAPAGKRHESRAVVLRFGPAGTHLERADGTQVGLDGNYQGGVAYRVTSITGSLGVFPAATALPVRVSTLVSGLCALEEQARATGVTAAWVTAGLGPRSGPHGGLTAGRRQDGSILARSSAKSSRWEVILDASGKRVCSGRQQRRVWGKMSDWAALLPTDLKRIQAALRQPAAVQAVLNLESVADLAARCKVPVVGLEGLMEGAGAAGR